jgi:hypothetical protein
VNDITLLDSWVISAEGNITKNIDLFPVKVRRNLNGYPIKAVVRDGHWSFTTIYVYYKDSNGRNLLYIGDWEMDLLRIVLQQMNMTFEHVHTPKGFEIEERPEISN